MWKLRWLRISTTIIISLLIVSFSVYSINWGYNHINRKLNGVANNVYLEGLNMAGYLPHEVIKIVELLALEKERKPQNAGINKQSGQVIPSKSGIAVDQERTIGLVLYGSENTSISLITHVVEPEVSTDDLAQITKVIGSYATYAAGSPGRIQNIKTASQSINNTLLLPNQIFSFNQVTGPKTISRGYHLAPVIIKNTLVLGEGGGVCQVSSTLYNAARKSNLEIIERHAHSKPVRYVPPGYDAAVADGSKDMKFRNTYTTPIIIKANVQGARINIWILGNERL